MPSQAKESISEIHGPTSGRARFVLLPSRSSSARSWRFSTRAIEDEHLSTNPARSRRMKISVPEPTRTFLEIDELVAALDSAGTPDRRQARCRRASAGAGRPRPAWSSCSTRGCVRLVLSEALGLAAEVQRVAGRSRSWPVRRPPVCWAAAWSSRRWGSGRAGYAPASCVISSSGTFASTMPTAAASASPIPRRRLAFTAWWRWVRDLVAEWKLRIDRLRRAGRWLDPDAWAIQTFVAAE